MIIGVFEVNMRIAFFFAGAVLSIVQYLLATKVFFSNKKSQLGAIYTVQRLILSFVFLAVVMVVSFDSLLYAAIGLITFAVLLPIVFNRMR